jgi:tellurite resistance-related uncharacterized protein
MSHHQQNAVTTKKIRLFSREEKPLAWAMQSHETNNDTFPPLVVILENRCVLLFHEVGMV